MQELVILRICWWIKGWGSNFPYSPSEVLMNPRCLKSLTPQCKDPLLKKQTKAESWSPASNEYLKWNVDASLNPMIHKSAVGGVLRDHKGKFIWVFSSPIPWVEINHAKILAIHRAIQLFLAHDSIQGQKLIIESDSANAVKWCTTDTKGPWNLTFSYGRMPRWGIVFR